MSSGDRQGVSGNLPSPAAHRTCDGHTAGAYPDCGGFGDLLTYVRVLDALVDSYPLPDVELVISQRDTNELDRTIVGVSATDDEKRQLPWFRYARTDDWNEILIPVSANSFNSLDPGPQLVARSIPARRNSRPSGAVSSQCVEIV